MDINQFRRFARVICDHSETKRLCGKALNKFASHMGASEAASFVCEIVAYDFFLDLSGPMSRFYKQMPEIRDEVEQRLNATRNMDGKGNLMDSDEDEHGNLR
jgi:hypothetical protein